MSTTTQRKYLFFILFSLSCLLFLVIPSAEARYDRSEDAFKERRINHICQQYARRPFLQTPSYCSDTPTPSAPTLEFTASDVHVLAGESVLLSWESEDATECTASGGWSGAQSLTGSESVVVSATTSYYLTCSGAGGEVEETVTVTTYSESDPEPEPNLDHLIITEVLYDLANNGSQGSETGGSNEWVEIYNPTNQTVDLMNWEIGDGSSNDVLSETPLLLSPGSFLVVTNAESTGDFWDLEDTPVIFLGSSISGGLANTGDFFALYDSSLNEVDSVSYGTNVTAFDPSAPDVTAGHSLVRVDTTTDTDSAADWTSTDAPTPGS